MLQHVLVGLDGSPLAETILPYVTTVAKGVGADVTLLHVVHVPEDLREGEHQQTLQPLLREAETRATQYLHQVAQRLAAVGLTVQSHVRVGEATTEILRTAQQEGKDLIALATHGRSGLQRWVYGSVAEKVLHTTHTPLLLIRPTEEPVPAPSALTQVIVPLDGSPLAEAALPVAETLALRCGVPLVLLRVVEIVSLSFVDAGGIAGVNSPAILDSLQEAANSYLAELAMSARDKEVRVQTAAPAGLPADTIVRYVHDHAGSVVVMSTHGRTGLASLALGSVARRVVQHGNTPTLIVRPRVPPAAAAPAPVRKE
jgi:nucleotide-binding universal stress UspA family protein